MVHREVHPGRRMAAKHGTLCLKPQDSLGRFVNIFLYLQEVDHTIRKHH